MNLPVLYYALAVLAGEVKAFNMALNRETASYVWQLDDESNSSIFNRSDDVYSSFFGFSVSFLPNDKDGVSILIGSPKTIDPSEPNTEPSMVDTAVEPMGNLESCDVSAAWFANDLKPMCQTKNPPNPAPGDNFGLHIPVRPDGNILTCSPTREQHCETVRYNPGACYKSSDFGSTWEKDGITKAFSCPVMNIEVLFVLDGSGSVGKENFEIVKEWVKNITQKLDIDSGTVTVGVVQYSHYYKSNTLEDQKYIETYIEIGQYTAYSEFANKIDKLELHGYTTYTGHALQKVALDFQETTNFNTTSNRQIMILLTDGKASDDEVIPDSARALREMGVIPYAVGVGDYALDELRIIANGDKRDNTRVFTVGDFDGLDIIARSLETAIQKIALEGGDFDLEFGQLGLSGAYSKKAPVRATRSTAEFGVAVGTASTMSLYRMLHRPSLYEETIDIDFDTDADPTTSDPCCNGDDPVVVTGETIIAARDKVKDGVVRTPCTRTRLSESVGCDLYFKKEFMQFTGSFKDRGALLALLNLTEEQKRSGVVTTSAGNHAQAMAHQGGKLDVPVTVVMPKTAPLVKVASCRDLRAEVILRGNRFDEAKAHAMKVRNERNLTYIDGYDHPDIVAGQGTVGIEILEDVPDVEYIIVPIGGGGLIGGVSAVVKHLKPNVKIIGVESKRCPSWHTAVENGKPIKCQKTIEGAKQSISDGLNVIRVGYNAFASAKIDKLVTVSEDYIAVAILRLLEGEKSVVEGAGAVGYAALLSGCLPELQGKKVACILTGGNIDATVLGLVIDRALVQEGRLARFLVLVSDRPGGLARLVSLLAQMAASVKDIGHDRISLSSYVYMTGITCTIETRDKPHAEQIRNRLEELYKDDLKWQYGHEG